MADQAPTEAVKPPPLHERDDVFENIAALYNGGNNLMSVQDTYRGACKLLTGTAIPKDHSALAASVATNAELIELGTDPIVHATVEWIELEKARHAGEAVAKGVGEGMKAPLPSRAARQRAMGLYPTPVGDRADSGLPSDSEPPR